MKIQSKIWCEIWWGNLKTWEIKQKENMNYYLGGVLERGNHLGKALETLKENWSIGSIKNDSSKELIKWID